MTKLRILIFPLLFCGQLLHAQVPKYFIHDAFGHGTFWSFGLSGSPTPGSTKYQSLYAPSDFPGAPSGIMSHIFVRVTSGGGKMPDFSIKMGYTSKTKFVTNGGSMRDAFFIDLSTVFSRPGGYGVPATDTPATWIRIPLDGSGFYYDKAKGFVVEFAFGPPSPGNGFCLYAHNTRPQSCLVGPRDSTHSRYSGSGVDFGFDLATTGVDKLTNITSFGLFPNPAVDGRFNVSFDAKQPVDDVLLTMYSATGELVLTKSYSGGSNSFFKEVDLNGVAKGTYFVKVTADGESITRSVVVP